MDLPRGVLGDRPGFRRFVPGSRRAAGFPKEGFGAVRGGTREERRSELRREGEPVRRGGVGEVLEPIRDWSFTSDERLDVHPEHGEHGETAVLELFRLELDEGVRIFGESEGVEGLTGVQGVRTGFAEGTAG